MRRTIRALLWIAGVALVALAAGWWLARPAEPDAFYAPPRPLPAQPGVLLRHEPFTRGVSANAQAWRILYTTTRADASPALASAIVMVARQPASGPRPVIAWTHGTTGVAPGCAPSLLDEPFANVPALAALLERGWIYVATDYVGQGTAGPHPYLIGEGEARSALDAVRAARELPGLRAGDRTVVWGHSQGGHAALWTGMLASRYAPDVPLAGVAAAAPASDLRALIEAVQSTPIGRIMSSYVLHAYAATYPDVTFANYVANWKRLAARDMASRCLAGRQALFSAGVALLAGGSIFAMPPASGALGARLAQNTPNLPLPAPLLIAQGLADDLVLPSIQATFVRERCAQGQALAYLTYAGQDHLSIVGANSPLAADLVRWTADRIAGVPGAAGCIEQTR